MERHHTYGEIRISLILTMRLAIPLLFLTFDNVNGQEANGPANLPGARSTSRRRNPASKEVRPPYHGWGYEYGNW